jgi:hypothetical protein
MAAALGGFVLVSRRLDFVVEVVQEYYYVGPVWGSVWFQWRGLGTGRQAGRQAGRQVVVGQPVLLAWLAVSTWCHSVINVDAQMGN